MKKYKAVIFDLGLTLIYSPRVEPFRTILRQFDKEIEADRVEVAYGLTDKHFMKNYSDVFGGDPKVFYKHYLSLMFAHLNLDLPVQEFYDKLFESYPPRKEWVPYDDTIDFLKDLREMDVRTGVISNWDLTARGILEKNGMTDLFDDIVISSEVEIEKPNPDIFKISLTNLNLSGDQVLYVGDNYFDDVIGANALGIKTLLIDRNSNKDDYSEGDFHKITRLKEILDYL